VELSEKSQCRICKKWKYVDSWLNYVCKWL
jgi:hypothetical protein